MKKKKKIVLITIICTLIFLIIIGVYFLLKKEPIITYEYYINDIKRDIPSGTLKSYECNSNVSLTINEYDSITYDNLTKDTLCKVYYTSTIGEYIYNLGNFNNDDLSLDIKDNVRYVGTNPNNYIYFNCNDYSNPSKDTCDVYRIIGSMNNYIDGNQYYNLKIISNDILSVNDTNKFVWHLNKDDNVDFNDSSIYKLLNEGFYNSLENYSYGSNILNFKNFGLKDDITRNLIDSTLWKVPDDDNIKYDLFSYYSSEVSGIPLNIKVGLINISDYILSKDNVCYDYIVMDTNKCYGNSWINTGEGLWSINKSTGITTDGNVELLDKNESLGIYPVIYLKNDIYIVNGDGSIDNPYQITF